MKQTQTPTQTHNSIFLVRPELRTTSKHALYLNLVYKSLKIDVVVPRIVSFLKRLLQICCTQEPNFICAALYLISKVCICLLCYFIYVILFHFIFLKNSCSANESKPTFVNNNCRARK